MDISRSHSENPTLYWNLIKNVSDEIKLELISLLSQSLLTRKSKSEDSDRRRTKEFINRFYGAWQGDESADDLVKLIRDGRKSKDPISF